jgi:hypothetical protein
VCGLLSHSHEMPSLETIRSADSSASRAAALRLGTVGTSAGKPASPSGRLSHTCVRSARVRTASNSARGLSL